MIRALVAPAMENIPLEHERDLTNSASERIIFPEAFILTDYLLRQLDEVLKGLDIREDAVKRNLELTGGLIMSERLMLGLVERGIGRQQAHEILRLAAGEAFTEKRPLREVLLKNPQVAQLLTPAQLDECLDPAGYIGTAVAQVDRVIAELRGKQ
jgi:adenylosuccinate lyase